MSYKEKEYRQHLSLGQRSNTLVVLISINVILYVVLAFIYAFFYMNFKTAGTQDVRFNNSVLSWFTLPGSLSKLATRPWTLVTQMFADNRIWTVIGNMLWLWMFGYILQDLTGNRKLFPIYFYGALAGAIAFLAAVNLIDNYSAARIAPPILGASCGVMAIAIAVTTLAPGYRIFPMLNGGFPIWILTVLYLAVDVALL